MCALLALEYFGFAIETASVQETRDRPSVIASGEGRNSQIYA